MNDILPAGAGTPELRMWVRLLACAKVGEKRLRRNFETQFATTLPRFDVLAVLFRHPEGLRMSALSRELLVSNGNVTSIVRQLQTQGLVQSCVDPEDARSAIASLTKEGKEQFLVQAEAHHLWITQIFGSIPREKLDGLSNALDSVRLALSSDV